MPTTFLRPEWYRDPHKFVSLLETYGQIRPQHARARGYTCIDFDGYGDLHPSESHHFHAFPENQFLAITRPAAEAVQLLEPGLHMAAEGLVF